uniref:Elicitin-like protein n=1 Tax=Ascaris lumbricoides TaxID=6252 RepID=A0A0M3IJU9_ASCLU
MENQSYYWLLIAGVITLITTTNAADIYRFIEQNSFICQLSEQSASSFLTPSEAAQKGCAELCGRVETTGEACAEDELRKKIHCVKVPILCLRDFSVQYSGAHIVKRIAEAKAKALAALNAKKEKATKALKKEKEKKKKEKKKNEKKGDRAITHKSNITSSKKTRSTPTKRSSNSHAQNGRSAAAKAHQTKSSTKHASTERRLHDDVIDEDSEGHELVDSGEEEGSDGC